MVLNSEIIPRIVPAAIPRQQGRELYQEMQSNIDNPSVWPFTGQTALAVASASGKLFAFVKSGNNRITIGGTLFFIGISPFGGYVY
jgi:hypothetical protein